MAAITTLDTALYCSNGYVHIEWLYAPSANHYSYRVYGRNVGEVEWTLLHQDVTTDAGTHSFNDYTAASGIPQEWAVVEVTEANSTQTEEAKTAYPATPVCDHYWIVPQQSPESAIRLEHVTDDSYADEMESETLLLLGRGRKVEKGTTWGAAGSLTCSIHDNTVKTGREQIDELRTISRLGVAVFLRNPFGDVWLCDLGAISISRIPGVGRQEYDTVTIPYTEIDAATATPSSEYDGNVLTEDIDGNTL